MSKISEGIRDYIDHNPRYKYTMWEKAAEEIERFEQIADGNQKAWDIVNKIVDNIKNKNVTTK